MNKIIVIGNLTKKPELRYTKENKAVTTLSVAINNGKDDTTFLDFGVFGAVAENCCKYLDKGNKVAIEGMVRNNNYTDKDGKNVYSFRFLANNVEFLNTKTEQKSTETQKSDSEFIKDVMEDKDPFAEFGAKIELDENSLPF